ncbi:hypothetical protein AAFL37_01315 [Staphylococcus lugdunensis]|uniref:hypothetical protein n=1 Tax=Staphylococcus TaxID=1279 RepID=UPI00076AEA35|nr:MULTISPECIES: hypothetical protein [Staphylococcus]AMG64871.1 hypothetical protein AL501_11650 [Staphylococcus lugdunensis]ARJ14555.1 hypothetical protein B7468_09550 [Staphylococcus lugdunensis]MCH8665905.1 hypothetical protein [Staphylococcus lugdunensis]MCI2814045.1 hypothetical protein [Staphylococcus lugdunensis]MDU0965844.1 hypothetical protein [Staphylococcus lugdunensis]
MEKQTQVREKRTGNLIAISSLVFSVLLVFHNFVALDMATAKALLAFAGQKTSDAVAHNLLNGFRYTGIMYILAYLAGVIAFWNRHMYLWWFMFAVFVSNAIFTLINISLVIKGITTAHSFMYALPILIVIIGSLALALYMLVISIKRKSTFNR